MTNKVGVEVDFEVNDPSVKAGKCKITGTSG